ncbi:MAG: hypothetical protein LBD64_06910 [Odoribacteraceae bacterium]|jgi:hypothetical protein|nr:hypothetical protein [Odoribacteraceae bacterium]
MTVLVKILAFIASLLFALPTFSQVRGTPEDFARKRLENVQKATKISEQQEKELIALFLDTMNKRDEAFAARRENGESREVSQAKIQKIRDEEMAKIKKILSPEQAKAYTDYLEKMKQEAGQRQVDQEKK